MILGLRFPGGPPTQIWKGPSSTNSFPEGNFQVTLLGLCVFKVCRCHSLAGKYEHAIGEKEAKQDEGDSSGVFPGLLWAPALEGATSWTAL